MLASSRIGRVHDACLAVRRRNLPGRQSRAKREGRSGIRARNRADKPSGLAINEEHRTRNMYTRRRNFTDARCRDFLSLANPMATRSRFYAGLACAPHLPVIRYIHRATAQPCFISTRDFSTARMFYLSSLLRSVFFFLSRRSRHNGH